MSAESMRAASYQSTSQRQREPLRRRATSFLLALLAHVLIVLVLLRLVPSASPLPKQEPALTTFDVPPGTKAATPRAKRAVKRVSGGAAPRAAIAPAKRPDVPPTPPVPFPPLLRIDLASSDIGKIPSRAGESEGEGSGTGTGKDSGSAYGPGDGPGGARLYNAEWYREPTNAELNGYLPHGAPPGGWALIACQTIENYRVENCRSLGESPPGSGLSNAMRQAAWQFRVLPPRIGGKKVVGAWVRIRISFTEGGVK